MNCRVSLSVVTIVRNESAYIAEWIAFHRLVGVDRFYIYDDKSTDDTVSVLRKLRNGGVDIVIIPWGFGRLEYASKEPCTFQNTPQITAYNHFVATFAKETDWAAFIDVDEFLYNTEHANIADAMNRLSGVQALFVSWLVFGSNGHKTKPQCLTVEAYTRRGNVGEPLQRGWGNHGKIVANPQTITDWGPFGSHNARLRGSFRAVDELGRVVSGAGNNIPSAQKWRLAHYYHRTHEEAAAKVRRDDRNAAVTFQPDAARLAAHDLNDVEDNTLAVYADAIRAELARIGESHDRA